MSEVDPALRIFIGYRRDDSQGFARSIHDRLSHHFGPDSVFRDINDIEPGMPWEDSIDEALGTCDVFVLLIGRGWLEATDDEGNRRIDDPLDRHRREIETAINRRIRMFVALMEDATMPRGKQLPGRTVGGKSEGLQKVPALHALRIADHAFDYGIAELISSIERAAEHARAEAEQAAAENQRREAAEREAVAERDRKAALEREAAADREREAVADREAAAKREAALERERVERARRLRDQEPRREEKVVESDERERPRSWLGFAAGLAAIAAIVAVILIVSSGGEEEAAAPQVYLDPIAVEGFPIGLDVHDNQVSVATRSNMMLVTFDKMDREPIADPVTLDEQAEDVVTAGDFAWVTLPQAGQVAQVSLADGSVVDYIPVGEEPRGITASEDTVWVANETSGDISTIDPSSGDATTEIFLEDGSQPTDIAVDGDSLWVSDQANDRVIEIDVNGNQEPFDVGSNPKGIVVADGDVWVANRDDGTVSRLGTDGTENDPIDVGGLPRGIAAGPTEGDEFIWVANGDGSVSAIDPETGEESRVEVGGSPEEIATGPERMWVTTGSGNSLVSIDPPRG